VACQPARRPLVAEESKGRDRALLPRVLATAPLQERDLFGRYLGGLSPGGGVGTILCGSNTTTEDFARWVLGTAETQPPGAHRAPSNVPFE
jgi:hypothetical protein